MNNLISVLIFISSIGKFKRFWETFVITKLTYLHFQTLQAFPWRRRRVQVLRHRSHHSDHVPRPRQEKAFATNLAGSIFINLLLSLLLDTKYLRFLNLSSSNLLKTHLKKYGFHQISQGHYSKIIHYIFDFSSKNSEYKFIHSPSNFIS